MTTPANRPDDNEGRLVWESPYGNEERINEGAERFIREHTGQERRAIFRKNTYEFMFYDSAWWYRIAVIAGYFWVYRTNKPTPRYKDRTKARSEVKRAKH